LGIFRAFNDNKIKYIVVGGLAVNLHGIPRTTYDIDLLVEMSDENLKKYLCMLKSWGFKPKAPVNMKDCLKEENRKNWIKEKNMKAINFYNDKWAISEIDMLIDAPIDYSRAKAGAVNIKAEKVAIPVISIQDLIKMKKISKREQDLSDITHLKKKL